MGRSILTPTLLLFSSTLLLLSTTTDNATAQERKLTLRELAEGAELIVEGKVADMQSEWNEDQTRIYTHVTVNVGQCIKGENTTQSVVVTHMGGEVGEVGEVYSGAARFKKDEEVLLFLNKEEDGRYKVTGHAQGKYTVTRDEDTNEKMVAKNKPLSEFKNDILRIIT